jgi:hypothetical protein
MSNKNVSLFGQKVNKSALFLQYFFAKRAQKIPCRSAISTQDFYYILSIYCFASFPILVSTSMSRAHSNQFYCSVIPATSACLYICHTFSFSSTIYLFSKILATSFKYVVISRCCGQLCSHFLQLIQSDALPYVFV